MASTPQVTPGIVQSRRDRGALIDTAFLFIALTALVVATVKSVDVMDEDIWWHIRTGQWILAPRLWPLTR